MSLEDAIIQQVSAGTDKVSRIAEALASHGMGNVRAEINRLLYRGKLQRAGRGRVSLSG